MQNLIRNLGQLIIYWVILVIGSYFVWYLMAEWGLGILVRFGTDLTRGLVEWFASWSWLSDDLQQRLIEWRDLYPATAELKGAEADEAMMIVWQTWLGITLAILSVVVVVSVVGFILNLFTGVLTGLSNGISTSWENADSRAVRALTLVPVVVIIVIVWFGYREFKVSKEGDAYREQLTLTSQTWNPRTEYESCVKAFSFERYDTADKGITANDCAEALMSRLENDIVDGIHPNPQTISVSLDFVQRFVDDESKYQNLYGWLIDCPEVAISIANLRARLADYQPKLEEAYQNAVDSYLGIIMTRDSREGVKNERMEAVVKLNILISKMRSSPDPVTAATAYMVVAEVNGVYCEHPIRRAAPWSNGSVGESSEMEYELPADLAGDCEEVVRAKKLPMTVTPPQVESAFIQLPLPTWMAMIVAVIIGVILSKLALRAYFSSGDTFRAIIYIVAAIVVVAILV